MWLEPMSVIAAVFSAGAAIVALFIAKKSYKVSRLQSRLSLFEQRFNVYEDVAKVILDADGPGMLNGEDAITLSKIKQRSQFLFGKDINAYIDELKNHASSSGHISSELSDLAIDLNKKLELKKERTSEKNYLGDQCSGLYERFKPYLNFPLN